MENQTITKNEGGVIVENVVSGTTNNNAKKLDTLIAVYNQGAVIMKAGMAIKMTALAIIDYSNLYSEKGYEGIIEFAEKELKLSAQTARRYLQTAKKFYDIETLAQNFNVNDLLDEEGNFKKIYNFKINSVLADNNGNDFTPTTLNDIAALPVDTVKELLAKNEISYEMTGTEIKTAVAPYRKQAKKAARQANKISVTTNSTTQNETPTENVNETVSSTKKENDNSEFDEIAKLKAQIAALQAENQKLQNENGELKNKISIMEENNKSSIETLQAANDTLQAENKKLKNSNNGYKAANSIKQNTIKKLQTENDTLKAEIDTLKGAADNETVNPATTDNVTICG